MASGEPNFRECPLVIWVATFRPKDSPRLKYSDLYNGVYLCDVMHQIDPRPAYQNVIRNVHDVNSRLQNWDMLLKNIRAYYADVLQQLLIVTPPNIQMICREPEKDASFAELQKMLLLILGCAVQGEQKKELINVILTLDVEVQQEIADCVKQITDDNSSIVSTECQDSTKLFNHLVHVLKERDDYTETMAELAHERDFYRSHSAGQTRTVEPTGSPEKEHIVLELTECKAHVRALKQELDEKQELYSDLCDEYEKCMANQTKLRNENVDLLKDARSARALRDELDILREKDTRMKDIEAEILRYKEKLNEMDYHKIRVEELRADNEILVSTKGMLEEQLSISHKRIETVVQLEQELLKYRHQIEELSAERDDDRERIRILAEENAELQFQKKVSMNEQATFEQEMAATKAKIAGIGGTISDQLKETTNAKILRLELENQYLLRKIEDMRESSLIENASLNLQLEKENQRLTKKLEGLQQSVKETSHKCFELEEQNRELAREKKNYVQSLELSKETFERQVKELEQQNEDLNQTLDVVRTRSEQTSDTKIKDLEKENKRLHETLSVKNQNLSKLEFEKRQLQKSNHITKENSSKIIELENKKEDLERKNLELKQTLESQKLACEKAEKIEQDLSDMEVEKEKLFRKVQTLQTTLQKKEQLEQEHINLTVENQKLQRMVENMKHSTSKLAELDTENSLLKKELQQQQRIIEAKNSQSVKLERMELDLMDLDNENMKLQRQLEITTNRVKQLEKDNNDLEIENEKLQEQIESSKFSQKRVSDLENQNSELEQECLKKEKENAQLRKENKRNKVTLEARESAIDDLTTKYSMLDLSHKELKRKMETQQAFGLDKEAEREHRELVHSLQIERQTVATLRNDLLQEKLRTQDLTSDLEKLHQDLERLGVKKGHLSTISQSTDNDSRFKALESMMEEGLNKSLAVKQEQIQSLESRLEESKNRNRKLHEELRLTRRECESIKQRYEEESVGREQEREESKLVRSSPFVKQESENQTGHLVKLERTNATLMAENNNLKSQNTTLNDTLKNRENQNAQLQKQLSEMHQQTGSLQSNSAKLQVENATLSSKCSSIQIQNRSLQQQLTEIEVEHRQMKQLHKDLKYAYEQLKQDHEELKRIHDKTGSEYEGLISEHGSMKSNYKTVMNENRDLHQQMKDLHQQMNNLIHGKDDENKIKDFLMREREQLQAEKRSLGNLQTNYNRLRDEHERLRAEYEKVKTAQGSGEKERQEALVENKKLKTELNMLQQDQTDMVETYRRLETDFKLLAERYDSLHGSYQKIEEEKEQLMKQVGLLIQKNQELLNQILGSKDKMAGQEKSYMEQLADLRRQKERLEEKIMDHYKNRDKQKKNKSLGAILLQKVRGLKRSKSRPNLTEGSPDSSSLGSGSFLDQDGGEFSKKSDKRRYPRRRGSAGYGLMGNSNSPNLAKQNKVLAKSTTALNSTLSIDSNYSNYSDIRGMGRPASDDEGGFRPSLPNNPTSPSGEFLTLEEFLAEGRDGSPKMKRKTELRNEDTESRSSENSDGSARRRRQAPLPPANNHRSRIGSIPDVAVTAQADLSMSRMSRVSTGSSGSSQDVRHESAFTQVTSPPHYNLQPNNTSTPAKNNNLPYHPKQYDDMNNSVISHIQRIDGHPYNMHASSPQPHQYKPDNTDRYSPQHTSTREPTPERENNRLTPDVRLDLLTRGSALSPNTSHNAFSPPHSYSSSPNDQRSRSQDSDMSVRSGQGHGTSPSWQKGQTPNNGQPRPMKATNPAYPRSHSPVRMSVSDDHGTQSPSTPQKKGNILVSRANIGPRPYNNNKNITRSRPASAFGAPVNNSYHCDYSPNTSLNNSRANRSDLNNSSLNQSNIDIRSSYDDNTSYHNGPSSAHSNGPVQSPVTHRQYTPRQERPKSVPPSMFNAQGGSDSDSSFNNNGEMPNHYGKKGTPPVPPPRKNKDVLTSGRYSVLREPSSPIKPMPTNRAPVLNNVQSASSPQGSLRTGQQPNNVGSAPRIGTPVKANHNKPPAPKPMPPEEGEQAKENSIWTPTRL